LEFYGIRGKFNDLIRSYLNGRNQSVLIHSKDSNHITYSKWGKVRNGVPQGSILGPLRFLCYINDLPRILRNKSKPVLFADNKSLIVTNSCPKVLKNDIIAGFGQLNEWFNNLLSLNYENTYSIHD
jgi:hypothetical protein